MISKGGSDNLTELVIRIGTNTLYEVTSDPQSDTPHPLVSFFFFMLRPGTYSMQVDKCIANAHLIKILLKIHCVPLAVPKHSIQGGDLCC